MEQVAQICGGCLIPGGIQGQAGQSSERPDLTVDVPVHAVFNPHTSKQEGKEFSSLLSCQIPPFRHSL